jgi:large subunit ribosomal protein L19e
MKLDTKKALAVATFGVGKGRIIFNTQRLGDIAEALTKQDMRDLLADGAISLKDINGRRTIVREQRRRRAGSLKKRIKPGKRQYVTITRKLRAYVRELLEHEKISVEQYEFLRKEIRAHRFKSKAHLKERMELKR